jgi:hypothetical protein
MIAFVLCIPWISWQHQCITQNHNHAQEEEQQAVLPPAPSIKKDAIHVYTSPPTRIGNCTPRWNYCNDTSASASASMTPQNKPIFVASFPGSGAEMFREIIESITGGTSKGWSVYDQQVPPLFASCHAIYAATCKTHWPVLDHISPMAAGYLGKYHSSAIVLIRNPAKAFASRLNHLWEGNNHVAEHSQQAPERAWNRWISKSFPNQISRYAALLQNWTATTTTQQQSAAYYKVALYLPYEGLTDPQQGPLLLQQVSKLLEQAKVPQVASSTAEKDLQCLWNYTVQDKPKMRRSGHSYTPGYTLQQHAQMLEMLSSLEREMAHVAPALVPILVSYRDDIAKNTRIIENPFDKKKKKQANNNNDNQ